MKSFRERRNFVDARYEIEVPKFTGRNVPIAEIARAIGKDGAYAITMEELGNLSGRFNYELACDLSKRVPRIYMKDGKILCTKDYYQDY